MDKADLDIVTYIEQPENTSFAKFFRSVQDYNFYYGLDNLFPVLSLLTQYKEWISFLDTKSVGELTHKLIVKDMILKGYNEIDQFIILDILILYFKRVEFQNLNESKTEFFAKAFQQEQDRLSQNFSNYSTDKLNGILDTLNYKTPQVHRDMFFCYYLQFRRGISTEVFKQKNFEEFFNARIKLINNNLKGDFHKSTAEKLLDKLNFPLNDIVEPSYQTKNTTSDQVFSFDKSAQSLNDNILPTYDDKEKLSIKDVAKILKYHESHIRRLIIRKNNPLPHYRDTARGRMYFFYPEILDWMKSNRQIGSMEEAGNVFRRKSKGAGKTRRPRMK